VNRKKLGAVLLLIAIAAICALALTDLPFITVHEAYELGTGVRRRSVEIHWPLRILLLFLIFGFALLLLPAPRPRSDPAAKSK
jgi:hypothetical protein